MSTPSLRRFPLLAETLSRQAKTFYVCFKPYQLEVTEIKGAAERGDLASLKRYLLFADKGEMAYRIFIQVVALAVFEDIGESTVPILERTFQEAKPTEYRCCEGILRAIVRIRGEAAGEFLVHALDHPSYGVRYHAAICIGNIGYALALPKLKAELSRAYGNPQLSTYSFQLQRSIQELERAHHEQLI